MLHGWGISIGIHAVLVLATGLTFTSWTVPIGGPDIQCSLRKPEPTLDRMDRIGDSWTWTPNGAEAHLPKPGWLVDDENEEYRYHPIPNPGWYLCIIADGEGLCGSCMREIFQEYQGRVIVIKRSEYLRLLNPYSRYADRRVSLMNNRHDSPRLTSVRR